MEKEKVSCIIPAYNEGERITNVLSVITKNNLINEIIVVDDYSKDETVKKIEAFPNVILLKHEINRGKSSAIHTGISRAQGELLLFVDADLLNLTNENINDLINPILSGRADVSISLRGNTPFLWKLIGLDYLSGERVIPKKILTEYMEKMKTLPGYGLEVFLNKIIIKNNCRIKIVYWDKVHSPYKKGGIGILKDIKGNIHMAIQVLKNISIFEALRQIFKMKKLMVK